MSMWFTRETTMTTVCLKPEDNKTNLTDSLSCPFFATKKQLNIFTAICISQRICRLLFFLTDFLKKFTIVCIQTYSYFVIIYAEQITRYTMREILLVGRACHGSREALEKLIRLYYDKIYNYIFYRVSDAAAAEDLTQEVFLKLTSCIQSYAPTASFSAFIYRIAHNTVVDYYRTAKRKREITEKLSEEISSELTVEGNMLAEAELKLDVQRLLDGVTPEQRECIILYYMQGLSYREISEVLEIPIPTAKSRVRRGLAACREQAEKAKMEFGGRW